MRALDVGCGPGSLTTELVRRLGAEHVAAVDPSEPFVEAARARHPGVDVRLASAESLPWPDGSFDVALAQLVVHFMTDPVAGLREMARVTRPGGAVAACVWDFGSGRAPLSLFWRAVLELDPSAHDESDLAGARGGDLTRLFAAAGLLDVDETELAWPGHSAASTTGGSRTRAASDRPVPTWSGSTSRDGQRCASAADRCCPTGPSR